MKRGNKSTGRTLRPVDFPELEKPIEEYHFARRMFGVHKNMHSPGFYLGEGRVAARYMEKAIGDLRKKQQLADVKPTALTAQSTEPRRLMVALAPSQPSESSHSLTPTRKRAPVLTLPPPSFPPFAAVLAPAKTEVSPMRVLSGSPKFAPGRSETPKPTVPELLSKYFASPRNDARAVHELASLPIFRSQKFTKMNPKVHSENPITGERRKEAVDSPAKKRAMGESGSQLLSSP